MTAFEPAFGGARNGALDTLRHPLDSHGVAENHPAAERDATVPGDRTPI
jgi:hypothetical protein